MDMIMAVRMTMTVRVTMAVVMTMIVLMAMIVPVAVIMAMLVAMMAAAKQENARDIDDQSQHRDRNGFVEIDRNRPDQALCGFISDQDRDHGEDNGAGKSGEVAELAGTEGEARVVAMAAGIAIGQSREQERAGMRRHVQPVGDERDRAEHQPADDFGDHHDAA